MKSLVLWVPMRCSWEQRGVLTCWSRERSSSFSRAWDFLAALLLPRWHMTVRVPLRGRAPWSQGAFSRGRRLRRPWSFIARAGRGAVQRERRRGGAPSGADELGDLVEPLLVDVVDWAVAQELVCRDERSSGLHGRAGRARRRTSRGERGCSSAAVSPHGRVLG